MLPLELTRPGYSIARTFGVPCQIEEKIEPDWQPVIYDGSKGTLFAAIIQSLGDKWSPAIENIIWDDKFRLLAESIEVKGFSASSPSDILNLTNPEIVRTVMDSYIDAGSEIIQTNTFGANRINLSSHYNGITGETVAEINRRGAEIAREAAGNSAYVAGDIGPLSQYLEPVGTIGFQEAQLVFEEQARALSESGVDFIHIETMSQMEMLDASVRGVRTAAPEIPLMVTMSFDAKKFGYTSFGVSIEQFVDYCRRTGITMFGANCGNGLEDAYKLIREFRRHICPDQPNTLIMKLNLGVTDAPGGYARKEYLNDYTIDVRPRWDVNPDNDQPGADIVGTCCRSGPEDIMFISNRSYSTKPRT